MIQTGASTAASRTRNSTSSPLASPRRSASAGPTSAALSQVSLVRGLGNSCSQALFAKRPSQTVGSGAKIKSRELASGVACRRGRWRRVPEVRADRSRAHRQSRAFDHAPVQRLVPERVGLGGRAALGPELAHQSDSRSRPLARAAAPTTHGPTCRRRAARSRVAGSRPCRRTRAYRTSSRENVPAGSATRRATTSHRRRGSSARSSRPSRAASRSAGRPARCRPGCRRA